MKIKNLKGFTLVELLIVIALIGILSVAVLATINPIEQANKARDAKFKNDVAEVLGALERYYASQSNYPWNTAINGVGVGDTVIAGSRVAIGASEPRFGVGIGDTLGGLIATSELKTSFAQKEPFTSTEAINNIFIWHDGVSDNYVCFHPKARANRNLITSLKCLTSLGVGASLIDAGQTGCDAQSADSSDWVVGVGSSANLMCVPE